MWDNYSPSYTLQPKSCFKSDTHFLFFWINKSSLAVSIFEPNRNVLGTDLFI